MLYFYWQATADIGFVIGDWLQI